MPSEQAPYSVSGDIVQVGDAGFQSNDPIIYNKILGKNRWLINETPAVDRIQIRGAVQPFVGDIGAVFEDDQYYYICSSGYPTENILVDTEYNVSLLDQKHLKLIRKRPVTTTEVYETSNRDVGIFIDGVPALGYKSDEFVSKGQIESTAVENRGFSYANPPLSLIHI